MVVSAVESEGSRGKFPDAAFLVKRLHEGRRRRGCGGASVPPAFLKGCKGVRSALP